MFINNVIYEKLSKLDGSPKMTKGRIDCKHIRDPHKCSKPVDVELKIAVGNWIGPCNGLTWAIEDFKNHPNDHIETTIKHALGKDVNGTWTCLFAGYTLQTLMDIFTNKEFLVFIELEDFDYWGRKIEGSDETIEFEPGPTDEQIDGFGYLVKTIEKLEQHYFPCVNAMTVNIQLNRQELIVKEDE